MDIPGGIGWVDRVVTHPFQTNTFVATYALEARLDALRQQRMLLRLLRDDVDAAASGIAAGDLTGSWRSEAQRGYDDQRNDLAGELRRAWGLLDTALTEVNAAIDEVGADLTEATRLAPGLAPDLVPTWVPR